MYFLKSVSLLAAALMISQGCEGQLKQESSKPVRGLKDFYSDFFYVGASVTPSNLDPVSGERGIIDVEFNSLTAENVMKMGPLHPKENEYYWTDADKIVNFAVSKGYKMRGHTLCWHRQTPSWIFKAADGSEVSKELLLKRLENHIKEVVTRYKGKVYAWDVVNEVIDDNISKVYRESPWYLICGEEYIEKAFIWAHEADPDALLFYNDYSTENPVKRDKIFNMLKGLKEKGVPVHGIGLQGHWSIGWPSEKELRDAIEKYRTLGFEIQVTELDISVYNSSEDFSVRVAGDDAFTTEREEKQIEKYRMIFDVFRDYKGVITSVTFWNVSDRRSWLDNFPVPKRKNYPLLFGQNYERKKAYGAVTDF
jgi:endo-1,4-beta-xylanase